MTEYIVHSDKLIGYLLDPLHPKGGPKCRLFVRYGFATDRPTELAQALVAHAEDNRISSHIVSDVMTRRVIRGPLLTPSGARPHAISVWQLMPDGRERLITAYIRDV